MLARVYAVAAILFFAVSSCSRFPESEFELRMDSRLPKFIDSTGARSPTGYTARVEIYDSPDPVRVIVKDSQRRTIFDQRGGFRWHPRDSYQGRGQIVYPSHFVVSFPSGDDIFEQRVAEPVLYLSDDAGLWSTLKQHLTSRWSQPLAVVMTAFDFMKQFREFATLAPASGGSAPSR